MIDQISLSERDIFFDWEVVHLLHMIRQIKNPTAYVIAQFDFDKKISLMLDKRQRKITNFYHSAMTPNILEACSKISQISKDNNINCDFKLFADPNTANIEKKSNSQCAVVRIEEYNLKKIKKGHRQNIEKASDKVSVKIYHGQKIDDQTLRDFYDSVVYSRRMLSKTFSHSYETFIYRGDLISKGKAILVTSEYEEKKSYVFALVSKPNSFYMDSGYNTGIHPFTAHYAHHALITYLRDLGGKYYNLGAIENVDASNNSKNKNDTVEYYKMGFCENLFPGVLIT
jgi:hypothetical protein